MNIKITWYGHGGEIDSAEVDDKNEDDVGRALAAMIERQIVSAGDSFTVEYID